MNNVLLILLITYVQSLQTDVYQHSNGITWNQARDKCKPFGLENRDDYLQKSAILDKREFWIGKAIYREPARWIEIIGCFYIRERDIFHSVASVGACQQKCESENRGMYFGYRKIHQKNCACQYIYMKWNQKRMESCVKSENFFVYKYYDGIVHMSSDPGNCTTVCCETCNMPTKNVNQLESRRCSSVDARISGRCGRGSNIWFQDYFTILDLCMQRNGLLQDSAYCQRQMKQTGQMSWTNVFREEVEIIKTEDLNEDPVRCFSAELMFVNERRMLNVSDTMCSKTKNWYICKTNSSVTESITQRTFSTIAISKGKHINISSGQSLTPETDYNCLHTTGTIETETITQNPLFTLAMSKDTQTHTSSVASFTPSRNKTSTTGAMIGGILGACCLLFVSAVLIVCKIRSKGIFKQTTKYVKENKDQAHFSNTIYKNSNNTSNRTSAMPTSNQTYGLDGASTPVYAEVNKSKKLENPDETYTDAGYGEYDHLHDIQNRRICPNENLYHSHGAPRNEEDQTYDSSDLRKGKLNQGNDLYDHVVEGDYMSNGNHDRHNSNDVNIYDKGS